MSEKVYDTLIFIGRFEPVHNGHVKVLQEAARLAKHVLVIIGSAEQPRSIKNPFLDIERKFMLEAVLESDHFDEGFTYTLAHNIDTIYNDTAWVARVQAIAASSTRMGTRIGIIGHTKDESSFYLSMFPQWDSVEVPMTLPINATDIRKEYLQLELQPNWSKLGSMVPASTITFMRGFAISPAYLDLCKEMDFVYKYKKGFESLPYPPVFVTVDAVVVCMGHVLMVKRSAYPGVGLWALPGGFLDADTDRSVRSAMLRELREETKIKVPEAVLNGSIRGNKVYDALGRSTRGRTITHAFKIMLDSTELPVVKCTKETLKTQWVPISQIKSTECFEDHYEILHDMLGL